MTLSRGRMAIDSAWPRLQAIQFAGVSLVRGSSRVLDRLDLTFEPNCRYVLLGPSGAGKSSLLRLLNRLDDPTEGVVRLGGRDLKSLPPIQVRRSVGLVLQASRPLPGSVLENLAYPFEIRSKATPTRAELGARLEEFGLDPGWLDRDTAALSGGERQRLAIAVALGAEPEILALDEPTAALDSATGRRVVETLAQRSRAGLRTIVVTHNLDQAPLLGDWAIRLEKGAVADQGPTAEVVARTSLAPEVTGS